MNAPSNTPARMRSNARTRRRCSIPPRCFTRRVGVIAIALVTVTAARLAYAATASAREVGGEVGSGATLSGLLPPPFEALGDPVDEFLNPLLPHPDADPNPAGDDDSTEVTLECSPDTDTCVPGPDEDGPDERSYSAPVPVKPVPPTAHEHGRDDRRS